jgi:hypothetical protein
VAIDKLTTAVQAGKLSAEGLKVAIDNLPEVKNIDLLINLGGDGAAYAREQNTPVVIRNGQRVTQTRDSGGPGMAGVPYYIGTGAQPEVFIPSTNGTFIPNGMGGSNVTVNLTYAPGVSVHDQAAITDFVYSGIRKAKADGLLK